MKGMKWNANISELLQIHTNERYVLTLLHAKFLSGSIWFSSGSVHLDKWILVISFKSSVLNNIFRYIDDILNSIFSSERSYWEYYWILLGFFMTNNRDLIPPLHRLHPICKSQCVSQLIRCRLLFYSQKLYC
jgi:hypothetical protein